MKNLIFSLNKQNTKNKSIDNFLKNINTIHWAPVEFDLQFTSLTKKSRKELGY